MKQLGTYIKIKNKVISLETNKEIDIPEIYGFFININDNFIGSIFRIMKNIKSLSLVSLLDINFITVYLYNNIDIGKVLNLIYNEKDKIDNIEINIADNILISDFDDNQMSFIIKIITECYVDK